MLLTVEVDAEGRKLYFSDGGAIGPVPGPATVVDPLLPFRGGAAFYGTTPELGMELWMSDGTAEGTRPLVDFAPGAESTNAWGPVVGGEHVYFATSIPFDRYGLWATDGTDAGTVQVAELPAVPRTFPGPDGLWFFSPANHLWRSEGTVETTRLVVGTAWPDQFEEVFPLGGLAIYSARIGGQPQVWRTDGTEAGTFLLAEARMEGSVLMLEPEQRLVFAASTPESGSELWVTDGTREHTRRFTDVAAGPLPSNPTELARMGEELFFSATDGFTGQQLFAASMALVMDDQPPALTVGAVREEATGPQGAQVSFAITATDNLTPDPAVATQPRSGSTFALGTTEVVATARDEAGNSTQRTFTLTVEDTTAPVVSCPSPEAVAIEGESAPVTFELATATDAVSPVTLTHTPAPGTTLGLGLHTIQVTAVDVAGNSAQCAFEVEVINPEGVGPLGCGCTSVQGPFLAALSLLFFWRTRRRASH